MTTVHGHPERSEEAGRLALRRRMTWNSPLERKWAAVAREIGGDRSEAKRLAAYLRRRVRNRLKATTRNYRLYLYDLAAATASLVLALVVRLGLDDPRRLAGLGADAPFHVASLPWFVLVCAAVFPLTCLYSRDWRYASARDLMGIVWAAVSASLIFLCLMFVLTRLEGFPRSVMAIELLVLVPLLGSIRIQSKLMETSGFRVAPVTRTVAEDLVPVLLVGAGSAADIYLRALERDPHTRYRPVGILDVVAGRQGFELRGVPVLGGIADFDVVFAELEARGTRPRHLIFSDATEALRNPELETLMERAERLGLPISRPVPAHELRRPRSDKLLELRPIELTDLLERPQIALDLGALQRMVEGRRIVVTGAGGSIGSELVRQISGLRPAELVLIDNCEFNLYTIDMEMSERFPDVPHISHLCDVREGTRVATLFRRHRPHVVFNAAALKHVPMVELNPCDGILTNVIGTMNVADASRRCGAMAMVQISTDKVVNSTSVMGASKRLGELYCQALDLEAQRKGRSVRFMTVRFGNVLGSSGSLIPLFKRQIAQGGPVTVTDPEMTRFFMTIREAVELTLHASAHGLEEHFGQGQVFVLDMGEPIKIMDLARRMIRLAGYVPEKDIEIAIVGRRPGEKLFEELFDDREERVDIPVPGVLGAVPDPIPLETLREGFSLLKRRARAGDVDGALAQMEKLLPGYRRRRDAVHGADSPSRPSNKPLPTLCSSQSTEDKATIQSQV